MDLSKEECKDQEWIQTSTTPDPRHHVEKWQNTRNVKYKRAKGSALSQQVINNGIMEKKTGRT